MAALARGFSDRHFERGEGPGDEVDTPMHQNFTILAEIAFLPVFTADLHQNLIVSTLLAIFKHFNFEKK